jgi:hypothetical protein
LGIESRGNERAYERGIGVVSVQGDKLRRVRSRNEGEVAERCDILCAIRLYVGKGLEIKKVLSTPVTDLSLPDTIYVRYNAESKNKNLPILEHLIPLFICFEITYQVTLIS